MIEVCPMQTGTPLQRFRLAARWTQTELAARAGVSRALVSAVEAGRHLPRVDAALALARALGTTANALFGPEVSAPVDALSGEPPQPGTAVRVGFVGPRPITTPARHGDEGWEAIDDVVGGVEGAFVEPAEPQLVVAGCEPGLRLLERLLRARGTRAIAIPTSSASALAALAAGRLHGAVTHFTLDADPPAFAAIPVVRFRLASWRVGIAGRRGSRRGWWNSALCGRGEVIQREVGAGVQSAFESALQTKRRLPPRGVAGPRVDSHLAASRLCLASGLPAVTIEPAAAAVGVAFHPLETHVVELWLGATHFAELGVSQLLEAIHSSVFRRTLESVGGYDLSELGRRVA
ncbi:helix-turn-helix domain-containing protein [Myxococcota bacterium]|nr:helix-turn-helix domain-containing protein [Myxococcota bacterium]